MPEQHFTSFLKRKTPSVYKRPPPPSPPPQPLRKIQTEGRGAYLPRFTAVMFGNLFLASLSLTLNLSSNEPKKEFAVMRNTRFH